MKTNNRYLVLLALSAMFSTVAYAGDVVKDTLGTTASSAKTVEALLQGQVAGVRVWSQDGSPMSASGVSIRGVNSLRGGQQPLYIVDGAILNDSNTKNIDPLWQYEDAAYATQHSPLAYLTANDIESIEVLKDAAAAALYGSKGANGVVIITTKRVKDERSVITWDSNMDLATPKVAEGTTTGISHNHKVMVGGARNNSNYTLTGYFRDDNYVVPGTGSMKGGVRTSFESQANPVVWFGMYSNMSIGNTNSTASTAWFGQESYGVNLRDPKASYEGWAADYNDDVLDFRTVNSMWLKLNLAKGFSFKLNVGADYQYNNRNFWWGNGTPFGLANNGAAAILNTSSFAYNADAVFRYQTFVNEVHHLDISLGAQAVGSNDVLNTMNGTDFYNHTLRYKSLNISGSVRNIHKFDRNLFALGVFGSLSYSLDGYFGFDVAYRTDYNPEFGSWNMYPSISANWDLKKTFFESSDLFSTLKIQAGYGATGKDDTIPYELIGGYTPFKYVDVPGRATPFYDARNYIHTKEKNVSLTFGMFNDRLLLTAGYYKRNTTDALTIYCKGEQVLSEPPVEYDEEGNLIEPDPGFVPELKFWQYADRQVISNQESTITNEGVELSVSGVPVQTEDWTWSVNTNLTYNVNSVSKLHPADMGGETLGAGVVGTGNVENKPVSSFIDEDGKYIGSPTPKWYGALSTTLRWKDLSLDILADGAAGHKILNLNSMYLKGATKVTGTYTENGDFLRLARVSLAYNIPVKNVKWMESFKVFATASNLAVLTSYNGWSPDVNSFAASNFRLGVDYGSYPAARSFVLGFSIKF